MSDLGPVIDLLIVLRDRINEKGVVEFLTNQTPNPKSSVLTAVLSNPHIPVYGRTVDRVLDEDTAFLFASSGTTSRTIAITMLYSLCNTPILDKLREELETLSPSERHQYPLI